MYRKFGFLALASGLLNLLAPNVSCAAEPSPSQCIKSFMITIYSAKSLSQIEQYFCSNQRNSFKAISPADRNKKLEEFKAFYLGNAKYSHEKLNGNKASVEVAGVGYQKSIHKTVSQNETFDLVKENNYWRIEGARLSANFRVK